MMKFTESSDTVNVKWKFVGIFMINLFWYDEIQLVQSLNLFLSKNHISFTRLFSKAKGNVKKTSFQKEI